MVDSKCPCDAMIFHSTEGMFFCTLSSKKAIAISSLYDYEQSSSSDFVNFTFTGKEKDEETGYGYFGARYMDHELLTSFMSVDRYADKYPSISPYAYCAWNPIKLIDPSGDTIIVTGKGGTSYYWYQGNLYKDCNYKNKVTDEDYYRLYNSGDNIPWDVSSNLNQINNNSAGEKVLNKLSNDESRHNISIEWRGEGGGASSNGNVYLNGNAGSLRNLSHELFHAYQYANGRRGRSIFSEVEAYVFQAMITNNPTDLKSRNGNKTYDATVDRLVSHFSMSDFMYVMQFFRQESRANAPSPKHSTGLYNESRYNQYPRLLGIRGCLLNGLY